MGGGGGGSSSPSTFDYHSGGGGGGLKLPGTGAGGAGAGGAGGGIIPNAIEGTAAEVTDLKWKLIPLVNNFVNSSDFELDISEVTSSSVTSPGSGYIANSIIEIDFPYQRASIRRGFVGPSSIAVADNPNNYPKYNFTFPDGSQEEVFLDVLRSPTFKIGQVDSNNGIVSGIIQDKGRIRFIRDNGALILMSDLGLFATARIHNPITQGNAATISFTSAHHPQGFAFKMNSFTIIDGGSGFAVNDIINIPLPGKKTINYNNDDDVDFVYEAVLFPSQNAYTLVRPTFKVTSVDSNGAITNGTIEESGSFQYFAVVEDANDPASNDFFGTGFSFTEVGGRNFPQSFDLESSNNFEFDFTQLFDFGLFNRVGLISTGMLVEGTRTEGGSAIFTSTVTAVTSQTNIKPRMGERNNIVGNFLKFQAADTSGLNLSNRDIDIVLPGGNALGTNSTGGPGILDQTGAGGGGWGAAGGNTGTLIGGAGGSSIESTFTGFNPTINDTSDEGQTFGPIVNLGQDPPEIFWVTDHDPIGASTNTTNWKIVIPGLNGIVLWGDGGTDTFFETFSGDHQY